MDEANTRRIWSPVVAPAPVAQDESDTRKGARVTTDLVAQERLWCAATACNCGEQPPAAPVAQEPVRATPVSPPIRGLGYMRRLTQEDAIAAIKSVLAREDVTLHESVYAELAALLAAPSWDYDTAPVDTPPRVTTALDAAYMEALAVIDAQREEIERLRRDGTLADFTPSSGVGTATQRRR